MEKVIFTKPPKNIKLCRKKQNFGKISHQSDVCEPAKLSFVCQALRGDKKIK